MKKNNRLRAVAWPLIIILFFLTIMKNIGFDPNLGLCAAKYGGSYASIETLRDNDALRACGGASVGGSAAAILSGDQKLGLDAQNGKLFLTELSTLADGENRLADSSEFALPRTVSVKGTLCRVSWKLERAETIETTENGAECVGVTYSFISSCGRFALRVKCLARPQLAGPFEFRTEIENTGEKNARIYPGSFASFVFAQDSGTELVSIKKESGMSEGYTHYDGQYFEGSGIYREPLAAGKKYTTWVNTYQSFNASGYLPMVYLDASDRGCYAALEWSSGEILTKCGKNGTSVSVDLDCVTESKKVFSTKLDAGETFAFPSVYLGAYDGALDAGSNLFKQWFFACKAPQTLRENANEPLTQMDFQSGLETCGIEAVKWDYGWWSADVLGNWRSLEGSWVLRDPGYINAIGAYGCETLSEFGALAKSQGKSLTTYVLLHDTRGADGEVTDAYGEFNSKSHSDWFSDRNIDNGMGNSADLGNEECVAYLKTALADFFNQNNVTTWRSDFEPICCSSDKENRHDANGTDVQYWCTKGFSELVDSLYENVPGFRYESCSSGGSMKDLFTATKAVVINCDDAANYFGMRATFYDSTYVIHPAQLQMPCNSDFANPDQALFHPKPEQGDMSDEAFRDVMIAMGFRTQCLGVPMFSSWTGTLLTDYYAEYAEMYQTKIRPLVRAGELYHILPRPDGVHWDGVQYADKDAEGAIRGAAFLFKPSPEAGEKVHITLHGLDADTVYSLVFEDRPAQNVTASGASLMTDGVDVTIAEAVGSEIVWITV
ncbi:MAG: GH36 C-terminal domain-containing protein [Clostridia bacterium]|nr:GH36 C-terminal domain-containing protein [Clostridia bacterium]